MAWALLALAAGALLFAAGMWIGGRLDERRSDSSSAPVEAVASGAEAAAGAPTANRRPAPDREEQQASPSLPPLGPLLALVIDDLGRDVAVLDRLAQLGVPLSYSVLPFESRTEDVVRILAERGAEVLCHLPMEADGDADPGPGALLSSMRPEELRRATEAALQAVPGAVGVNNHMGSILSTRRPAMELVLDVLARRRLFFLDSRTSAQSVGYALALERGIPATERQVFLDVDSRPDAIRRQFRELLRLADERGSAVAIGHPHRQTLEVLETEVREALAAGYRFVPVSYLLDRQSDASVE